MFSENIILIKITLIFFFSLKINNFFKETILKIYFFKYASEIKPYNFTQSFFRLLCSLKVFVRYFVSWVMFENVILSSLSYGIMLNLKIREWDFYIKITSMLKDFKIKVLIFYVFICQQLSFFLSQSMSFLIFFSY